MPGSQEGPLVNGPRRGGCDDVVVFIQGCQQMLEVLLALGAVLGVRNPESVETRDGLGHTVGLRMLLDDGQPFQCLFVLVEENRSFHSVQLQVNVSAGVFQSLICRLVSTVGVEQILLADEQDAASGIMVVNVLVQQVEKNLFRFGVPVQQVVDFHEALVTLVIASQS